MQIGIESGAFVLTFGGLLVFGCLYAWLIHWMRSKNYLDPFTAFMVVFGVLVTLSASIIVHVNDPLMDFVMEILCFVASGTPMIIGSMMTFNKAMERDNQIDVNQIQMGGQANGQA